MPPVRGRISFNTPLAPYTWLRVGGAAQVLFLPKDVADLSRFLGALHADIPVQVLGAASNVIVRDGGLPGVTVKLTPAFGQVEAESETHIRAGAAALDEPKDIQARMDAITARREDSQPIREKTGGSTFKNPDQEQSGGRGAWKVIDDAGGRGFRVGGAQMSEKHCNFMINTGDAGAADLEDLGEAIIAMVKQTQGVDLHWEIKRIGVRG